MSTLSPSLASPALPGPAVAGLEDWGASPAAAEWTAAVGHLSFALQPPAWHRPPADVAAPPLVIVGHDYVGPLPVEAAPQPALPSAVDAGWTAGLSSDDPFARLLAGLSGAPDGIWPG